MAQVKIFKRARTSKGSCEVCGERVKKGDYFTDSGSNGEKSVSSKKITTTQIRRKLRRTDWITLNPGESQLFEMDGIIISASSDKGNEALQGEKSIIP